MGSSNESRTAFGPAVSGFKGRAAKRRDAGGQFTSGTTPASVTTRREFLTPVRSRSPSNTLPAFQASQSAYEHLSYRTMPQPSVRCIAPFSISGYFHVGLQACRAASLTLRGERSLRRSPYCWPPLAQEQHPLPRWWSGNSRRLIAPRKSARPPSRPSRPYSPLPTATGLQNPFCSIGKSEKRANDVVAGRQAPTLSLAEDMARSPSVASTLT